MNRGFGRLGEGSNWALPIRITNSGRGFSAPFFVFVLLPAIFAMVVPFVTLGLLALGDAGARDEIAGRAVSLLMISLGLGVWVAMLGLPAWRYLKKLGWTQNVAITEDRHVFVDEAGLIRTRQWSCELDSFSGLKHRVRTDLSTSVHELVLVHEEPSRSVVVVSGAVISEDETELLAQILGLPVVSHADDTMSVPVDAGEGAARQNDVWRDSGDVLDDAPSCGSRSALAA